MNLVLMLVIVLFSVAPAYAQGQETNSAKLKADAENVVKIIGSDKAKTQTYCQFANLSDAIAQAIHEQDAAKAKELSDEGKPVGEKLRP
jgi:hypothetical protein